MSLRALVNGEEERMMDNKIWVEETQNYCFGLKRSDLTIRTQRVGSLASDKIQQGEKQEEILRGRDNQKRKTWTTVSFCERNDSKPRFPRSHQTRCFSLSGWKLV